MLAIRMQRTGRSGHTQFRMIVQDSRFSPTRGRVVAYVGSYNPHTKSASLDGEKISQYLQNGAQPSDTVARLLRKEGVKLPNWVKLAEPQKKTVRNPDKRRSTRPPEAEPAETSVDTEAATESAPANQEAPAKPEPSTENETPTESVVETSAEEPAAKPETPAEEASTSEEATDAPSEEPK